MIRMFLIAGAATLLLAGCEKEAPAPAAPPQVEVITAAEAPIAETIPAVGVAKAYDEVNLVARVEGYLVNRNFKEGQEVKKDQLLYEIEPVLYRAQVEAAEAELAKAKANLANAVEQYNRQQTLLKGDATSERAFQNAEADKLSAEADVRGCQARLETANQNLEYTRISAPFDGWVGLSAVSTGNLVNLETGTLAKVVKTDPMRVEFVITEMDILKMHEFRKDGRNPDVKVSLSFQDGTVYPIEGKISFWNNEINNTTGTLKLQAVFPNPDRKLLPGMFVRVKLEPRQPSTKLLLPLAALMNDQAGDYVYLVTPDGTVKRQTLKTAFRDDSFAVVTDNLKPGDRVVVKGLQKVRPGSKVRAVESADPNVQLPKAAKPEAPKTDGAKQK